MVSAEFEESPPPQGGLYYTPAVRVCDIERWYVNVGDVCRGRPEFHYICCVCVSHSMFTSILVSVFAFISI